MKIPCAHWLPLLALGAACSTTDPDASKIRVHERWFQPQVEYGEARPAVSGDTVVFTTGAPGLVARRLGDGTPYWSIPLQSSAVSRGVGGRNLLIRHGVVIVPILLNTVGIELSTGRQLWSFEAPLDTVNDPDPRPGSVEAVRIAADSETVYIPAWGGTVTALDALTGTVRWQWRVDAAMPYRSGILGAVVAGDTVYATAWHFLDRQGLTSERWLLALDRLTGREIWRFTVPRPSGGVYLAGAPVVVGNLVIFNAGAGHTWAVDRGGATLVWHFDASAQHAVLSGPVLGGDTVFVDGGEDHIHALLASTGHELWKSGYVAQIDEDLLLTARCVYASAGAEMNAIDRSSGMVLKTFREPHHSLSTALFASPAAAAAGGVFVTVNGGAWAFDEP